MILERKVARARGTKFDNCQNCAGLTSLGALVDLGHQDKGDQKFLLDSPV